MKPVAMFFLLALVAVPRSDAVPLSSGPYSHAHMKLERTWFGVDVANIDVWFDDATRAQLRDVAAGQPYSKPLAERIARTVLATQNADVQVTLLRNASMGEFLDSVQHNLGRARDAGYITNDAYAISRQRTRTAFAKLADRGFKKGDAIVYRVRGNTLRTMLISGGRVLVDVTDNDDMARRSMLASYFAPGTDFRDKLVKDLLR